MGLLVLYYEGNNSAGKTVISKKESDGRMDVWLGMVLLVIVFLIAGMVMVFFSRI